MLGPLLNPSIRPISRPRQATRSTLRPIQVALFVTDCLFISASLAAAFWIRMKSGLWPSTTESLGLDHFWSIGMSCVTFTYIFKNGGLYNAIPCARRTQHALELLRSITLGMLFLLAFTFMAKSGAFTERRSIVLIAWLLLVGGLFSIRLGFFTPWIHRFLADQPVLLMGTGESAQSLAHRLTRDKEEVGLKVVGMIHVTEHEQVDSVAGIPVLGNLNDLEAVIESYQVNEAIIADPQITHTELLGLIRRCKQSGLGMRIISDIFELIHPRVGYETLESVPMIRIRKQSGGNLSLALKRTIDLLGATITLGLISPVLVITALLIRCTSKGPILFRQERIGRRGKPFSCYKFRTMFMDSEDSIHRDYVSEYIQGSDVQPTTSSGESTNKIQDDPRVTSIGGFLRRWSIDELPQIFNVLRGEMSLIGPRPPLSYEVEWYQDWHRRRLDFVPGITGLWQVCGRNKLDFEQMVLLDIYYIENWSILLDLKILFRTLPVVLIERSGH
ncbi:MAG: sugar transferase [Planctomycetota bacterium]|nr:sugar transferase [Planctomycetota bacterium]